jgi:uncharacterized lipoprotein YehR (DUF1307 family)
MKMAKKLLAVILAGVLALSVLTGCGDAVSTKAIAEAMSDKTIAEAMSDVSKDDGFVYEADPKLNEKARQIAEMIRTKEEGNDSENKNNIYDEIMAIMGHDYDNKYVWIAVTATEGCDMRKQAENLLEDVDTDSNINSKVADDKGANGKKPANDRSIGTVPITENGVDYLFAVITAAAVQGKV